MKDIHKPIPLLSFDFLRRKSNLLSLSCLCLCLCVVCLYHPLETLKSPCQRPKGVYNLVRTLEQSGQAQLGTRPASLRFSVYPKQIIDTTLYYSVLTSDLIAPLVVVILTCISCISHWSLSPFLELCRTISIDPLLTWTTFSDHFWVSYHHIYTLILPLFTARDGLPSPCTLVFTVVFVVWLFKPYKHHSHISAPFRYLTFYRMPVGLAWIGIETWEVCGCEWYIQLQGYWKPY